MIQIHKPTRWTRFKRRMRRVQLVLLVGLGRGWVKDLKEVHELPETRERELVE